MHKYKPLDQVQRKTEHAIWIGRVLANVRRLSGGWIVVVECRDHSLFVSTEDNLEPYMGDTNAG